jgi:hypothetical protein
MRTTITIPDPLYREVRALAPETPLTAFARQAIAEKVTQLRRRNLQREMEEGYAAEADDPSLDSDWSAVDVEGWP